jgi:hypothetical protein
MSLNFVQKLVYSIKYLEQMNDYSKVRIVKMNIKNDSRLNFVQKLRLLRILRVAVRTVIM